MKTVFLVILLCLLIVISSFLTKEIIAEAPRESYFVSSVNVPFGFLNDPLPDYVAPYTNLSFKDYFYFGPCNLVTTGSQAIYGPAWFFAGKKRVGLYWWLYHDWGISYDISLKLNDS
jgi:hypothetical protein